MCLIPNKDYNHVNRLEFHSCCITVLDVENAVNALEEVEKTNINLVFEPPWDKEMLSEEARLELGML